MMSLELFLGRPVELHQRPRQRRRGPGGLLHRPRPQRAGVAYVYFDEEPGATNSSQLAHTRRGPAHRRQHIAKLPELLRRSPPIKRGVTRLQPHISRQSAQCRLRPQVRKYRRNAISVVMGQRTKSLRSSPLRGGKSREAVAS
jgi:hypothetical protein